MFGYATLGGVSPFEIITDLVFWCLVLFELARRVAQATPGKRDDEVIDRIEGAFRRVIDFLAGNHGEPGDPTMRKSDDD